MARIISNYTLKEDESTKGVNLPRRPDHIIKIPVFQNDEIVIPNGDEVEPEIEPEVLPPVVEEIVVEEVVEEVIPVVEEVIVPEEPKEPILQLIRNSDGIVIGIDVQCGCGEKIIIKMEY